MAFKGDDFMKNKSLNSEHVKMFCCATLSFYIITAIFYVLTISLIYVDPYPVLQLSELLSSITEFLIMIVILFSVPWFLITFIWCLVICKKEDTPRVFANPIIIINLLITMFLPIILVLTGF